MIERLCKQRAISAMPGGIGHVPAQSRVPCVQHAAGRDLPANASEKDIFYHLSHWRVFYASGRRTLYFSSLKHSPVYEILQRMSSRHAITCQLETMYLDPHHCFFGGYRVLLPEIMVKPLLVALRLQGVTINQKLDSEAAVEPSESVIDEDEVLPFAPGQ